MLFNGWGKQFGLLSGGCLEADIQRHAMQVMQTQQPKQLRYDATDEEDISFQLGIGCGGRVDILLQPITPENNYLELIALHQAYQQRNASLYHQCLDPSQQTARVESLTHTSTSIQRAYQTHIDQQPWLVTPMRPTPHLALFGGGVDAQPVASMAATLGWTISLFDPRTAYARADYFPQVNEIYKAPFETLSPTLQTLKLDAAIVMSHNIRLDADALRQLAELEQLTYLALLGPTHRKQEVLELAGLTNANFSCQLHGPAGLPIGGQLPESIALSIVSQCHLTLFANA